MMKRESIHRLEMTSDLVFRTVYGRDTKECKAALIAVLNLILERKDDPIVDLDYKNPFHLSQYIVGKQTIMDYYNAPIKNPYIKRKLHRNVPCGFLFWHSFCC